MLQLPLKYFLQDADTYCMENTTAFDASNLTKRELVAHLDYATELVAAYTKIRTMALDADDVDAAARANELRTTNQDIWRACMAFI